MPADFNWAVGGEAGDGIDSTGKIFAQALSRAGRHDDRPVGLFDILSIPDRDEYYRIFPDEGGRLALTPIDPAAASSRLGRIVGKQTVDGGATQLALHDGTTLRVPPAETDTYHTKDSVIITTDTREIEAHFPYEEGALVTAVDGQHA
ncbi:MAG: hypothetical protein RI531_02225, partial [Haloferacaceae archaeon]|nr:hypothetical protein [Haloferacaceae archaeon]